MAEPLKRGELFEKATNTPQLVEGRPGVVVVRVGTRVMVKRIPRILEREKLPF